MKVDLFSSSFYDDYMKKEEFEALKNSSIGHTLIKAGRLYGDYSFNLFKETIGEERLKPSHLQLFAHIPFSGITVVELAKKLNISKQAVSVLVNELIEIGTLLKKEHPTDKRSSIVMFNENGDRNIFTGMTHLKEFDRELEKIMGKNDSKVVLSSLLKVIEKLS